MPIPSNKYNSPTFLSLLHDDEKEAVIALARDYMINGEKDNFNRVLRKANENWGVGEIEIFCAKLKHQIP
jgi:hypothetical protein